MKRIFSTIRSQLLDLVFPPACLYCRSLGHWLCSTCYKQLQRYQPNPLNHHGLTQLDAIWAAGDYRQPLLAELIKKFKYNFLSSLAQPLGQFLISSWEEPSEKLTSTPLVIPLPLAPARERWRGFNQARLLAAELSAHFSYPLHEGLRRVRHCLPQVTLNAAERRLNIAGAFSWRCPALQGQTVILIDDVITSGSTINEAGRIVRAAGADKIYGLVLAKD